MSLLRIRAKGLGETDVYPRFSAPSPYPTQINPSLFTANDLERIREEGRHELSAYIERMMRGTNKRTIFRSARRRPKTGRTVSAGTNMRRSVPWSSPQPITTS